MLKKRSRSIQKDQEMGEITSNGESETNLQSDVIGQRQKTNSFFNVPGLFIGLTPKVVVASSASSSDCDSVRSPTSPLDFKLFCNLGNCFRFSKSSSQEGNNQKCFICHKVGLGSIVDDFVVDDNDNDHDDRNLTEKDKVIIPSSNSKTILFGSQIRSKGAPNSTKCANFCEAPELLSKNCAVVPQGGQPSSVHKGSSDVLFEIGGYPLESDPPYAEIQSFSLDSKRIGSEMYRHGARNVERRIERFSFTSDSLDLGFGFGLFKGNAGAENKLTTGPGPMPITPGNEVVQALTPEEIELSEDYTCVISHGPNPKTTHIFGDTVLECHPKIDTGNKQEIVEETGSPCLEEGVQMSAAPSPFPSDNFLSFCYFCKKKLEDDKDIYMYRGEKAFCSWDCRMEEISIEEEKEKSMSMAPEGSPKSVNNDIFESSIFVAI